MFQSLALFPHRSVGQNIEFPLKMKGVAAGVRRERALELMRMVRLPEDYYGKNVTKCSGGERQRVALARAFAYDPEILFFDEPLSAIDYKLRKVLERELKDIHKETGKTFMYITHSLEEAMVMSDRIGVMRSGRLVQVGTPEDIYNRPADRFVSEFMGDVNVITVMPNGNGSFEGVDVPGHFRAPVTASEPGYLVIRPEFLRFVATGPRPTTRSPARSTTSTRWARACSTRSASATRCSWSSARAARPGEGGLDRPVLLGWDAGDAIFVPG